MQRPRAVRLSSHSIARFLVHHALSEPEELAVSSLAGVRAFTYAAAALLSTHCYQGWMLHHDTYPGRYLCLSVWLTSTGRQCLAVISVQQQRQSPRRSGQFVIAGAVAIGRKLLSAERGDWL